MLIMNYYSRKAKISTKYLSRTKLQTRTKPEKETYINNIDIVFQMTYY